MPTYDYHCPTNRRTLEVRHSMSQNLATWGELCALAGIDTGDTPVDSPVKRLITGGAIIGSRALGSGVPQECPAGLPPSACSHQGHCGCF